MKTESFLNSDLFKQYGSEAWAMTRGRQEQLRTTQRRMLRQLTHAHKSYGDFENHIEWLQASTRQVEAVMSKFNMSSWTSLQRSKASRWAGKMVQTPDERWTATVAGWRAHGNRSRGRPKTRWSDSMNAFLSNVTGLPHTDDDWCRIARDVTQWSKYTHAYVAFADIPA